MLKRLIVLAAALAIAFLFAFVPTSSAQTGVPTECTGVIDDPAELEDCLSELRAPGGVRVPEECSTFVTTLPLLPDFTGGPLGRPISDLLRCLNAITRLTPAVDDPGGISEPYDAYDAGYDLGYDLGYDIGYDEGVPEGGVDSGFGPTGSDAAGAPLAARGGALLALVGVLATGLLVMRRRHGS